MVDTVTYGYNLAVLRAALDEVTLSARAVHVADEREGAAEGEGQTIALPLRAAGE